MMGGHGACPADLQWPRGRTTWCRLAVRGHILIADTDVHGDIACGWCEDTTRARARDGRQLVVRSEGELGQGELTFVLFVMKSRV